jgi:hypothetical protein
MPSPFPGMDPWLESPGVFPDLRFCFIVRLSGALNAVLPEKYYSRFGYRKWLEPIRRRSVLPDAILPSGNDSQPVILPMDGNLCDEVSEGFVEIRTVDDATPSVWTRLDIPSRENKTCGHESRVLYIQQQRRDIWDRVNRIEIDLLRDGDHCTLAPATLFPCKSPDVPYHAVVFRSTDPNRLEVYQFGFQERLPSISVPIGQGLPDVRIDLAGVLDDVYSGAAYERWGIYSRPCDPPLTPEQQTWAEGILREKGLLK